MAEHYLDDSVVHHFWDNSYEPRLEIEPGDTVLFECREASDRRVTPGITAEELATRERMPGHPLTGPVLIKGAQPGDVLAVEVLNLAHKGWGWNSHSPNFGLLPADQQTELRGLWEEFEARETADAKFAAAVDRVAPTLLNYVNREESSWHKHNLTFDTVVSRVEYMREGSETLWEIAKMTLEQAVADGYLAK